MNKLVLEQSDVGPWEKIRRFLDKNMNIKSTNRGFQTNNHAVAK